MMPTSRLALSRFHLKLRCLATPKDRLSKLLAASRSFASTSQTSSPSSSSPSQAIVELREDFLFPDRASTFVREVTANPLSALREGDDLDQQRSASAKNNSSLISPLRFFSLPSTGGPLHVATHAYYFEGGLSEREAYWHDSTTEENKNDDDTWQSFIGTTTLPYIQSQKSMLFVEAPLVREANLPGLEMAHTALDSWQKNSDRDGSAGISQDNCILEIRRYNLRLGYDTVPKFLDLYGRGLPSKLKATGTDPTTTLVTLLYSEVGRLNEVIEVWRHGNGVAAMEQSRAAARQAKEWRSAIAKIADLAIEFSATIHKPLSFSPIK